MNCQTKLRINHLTAVKSITILEKKIPFYFEPKDIDDITWIKPEHLKTGEDIIILGKTFYFGKTDDFTKHYYKERFGIDLPQIEIVEKPKRPHVKIVPPHGLGKPEETLQDCYVFERYPLGRFYPSHVAKSKEMADTVLRFAARMALIVSTTKRTRYRW
ncbi:EF-hand domain-containing protein 1 [Trichonephila clavipes]|nr:EF-hand domain-containing protein 1 [Trichonephila clavipes]